MQTFDNKTAEQDPATWVAGDIIADRQGNRAMVKTELAASGYMGLIHLAPGKKYDLKDFSLALPALTSTYSYSLEKAQDLFVPVSWDMTSTEGDDMAHGA